MELSPAALGLPVWLWNLLLALLKAFVVINFAMVNAVLVVLADRKLSARMQSRFGPEVAGGPLGILQMVADGLKLFAKEDVMPRAADRWVWMLAPSVAFFPVIMVFLVIPIGPHLALRDLNVGVVYLVAVTSFTALGIFMAGWGSNNKYSLLGAMRAIAQLVSYEIPLVLSMLGVVLAVGSLNLSDIAAAQERLWFVVPQFIGFLVFFIASLAELSRTPFDLSHADELVVGYLTEYSGIRFGLLLFVDYIGMVASSMVAATLFLGGWQGPFGLPDSILWLFGKTYFLVVVMIWIRWTLPRLRIDQVLNLGWKFLLPVSLANVLATGLWMVIR